MQLRKLEENGWIIMNDISSRAQMLDLACSLGTPISAPTGELVKILTPRESNEGPQNSFTATFGKGVFPFHTDTAFWGIPARYVVLRVLGDTRRPTLLLDLDHLWGSLETHERTHLQRSIWLVPTAGTRMYCSLKFSLEGRTVWRYDPHLMRPANSHASLSVGILTRYIERGAETVHVQWQVGNCLILDNWRCLHARGPEPQGEHSRAIERVYVN